MANTGQQRRVVIVDDSRTVQAMLDNAFSNRRDFRVVGFANDAASAAEMIRRLVPDVVTIDLCMPYIDGAALLEMIGDLTGVCKIVVSDKSATNLLLTSKLLQAGASICLGKTEVIQDPTRFFDRINAAADAISNGKRHHLSTVAGRAWPSPNVARQIQQKPVIGFPVPVDESQRLDIIRRKKLANSIRERQFDAVTKHIAKVTAFPSCLLTVIDRDTQWVKSVYGLEVESTPRHQAFCNYTISQGGVFVVTNTHADERFAQNDYVTGDPHIRSYAGYPVTTTDGVAVASLCVIDNKVRTVSKHVIDQLAGMSEILTEMIEVRPSLAA